MTRIATVFGATGAQGSSVIDAILKDGTFTPRAVTRDTSSAASKALAARGVEVVKADLQDFASVKLAVNGSECVFAVTKPYVASNTLSEYEMARNMIDASKDCNVSFLVWSSLPSASKLSGGKYTNVKHFDGKAAVDEYLGSSSLPHAIIHNGYYLENLWGFQELRANESGILTLTVPVFPLDRPQVFTWVQKDIGPSVLALMKQYRERGAEILNQTFVVATARMTYQEYASILSKGLGKPIEVKQVPTMGMAELDDMLRFEVEFGIFNELEAFPDPRLVALGVKPSKMEEFIPVLKANLNI